MTITLIDFSANAVETIARSAGVCYGNDNKDLSRIGKLKKHKHLATMRFAHAVFKIEDISIACQNQFVRSKHLDFLVESKRYVDASERGFVMPENIEPNNEMLIKRAADNAMEVYKHLVNNGMKKEDARAILPMNTMTSMYVAGNFQAWMDFLKLRVSKHAQKEIQLVALNIWSALILAFPHVFADLKFEDEGFSQWKKLNTL